MRLVVLTTDTLHHRYFVRELARTVPDLAVLVEDSRHAVQFPTHHPFEDERETVESTRWFDGSVPAFSDIADLTHAESINSPTLVDHVRRYAPDLGIVFGTGKIRRPMIDAFSGKLLNLHGGDPEYYRGLDSHLWAIYHRDFANLVTTIHRVNPTLDDGDIVLRGKVPLKPKMSISELRAENTEVCVGLAKSCIAMVDDLGDVISHPQQKKGRYYSAMPGCLKPDCVRYFDRHIRGLA